ncbi:MAG TPA: helix-turn-helix transcriptional regulator [Kofleriaceae bacterium]|jgi:DNA-binding CsgD family transcriptional regulator
MSERFVDIAALACAESARLGTRSTWIALRFADRGFAVSIDDARELADTERLRRLDREPQGLVAPLVGRDGTLGAIAWQTSEPPPRELERELMLVATRLALWCAVHGIASVPRIHALGPSQHRIAELAARGFSNAAIGAALAISINTVKARLKEVFERLAVHNRTELAHTMLRRMPLDGIAPGITRLSSAWITRAARAHDM